jgi:COMPASS component SWD2
LAGSILISGKQFTHVVKGQPVESHVTSLDFDDQGEYLVAASADETMHIFDVKEGKRTKLVPSKKYGIHLARFTHHSREVLYASTKVDDSLRLLELHNESYVRYFTAHTSSVTCVALSPGSDGFLSCGTDDTVCLWDLKSRNPTGKLKLSTPYLAAYDPSANVMAIASQSTSSILLYDVRNFDKAPFSTFELMEWEDMFTPSTKGRAWTKLEFSNDGKSILLSTDYHGHFIVDAFDGKVKVFLTGRSGSTGRAAPVSTTGKPLGQGDACFTQDGRYVIGGTGDHPDILVWDTHQSREGRREHLQPISRLPSRGIKSAIVECNPRYNMFATADTKVCMWLPSQESKD